MKKFFNLIICLLFILGIHSVLFAQQAETRSVGEIKFDDDVINSGFNRVYLLQPGENVIIKNLCSKEEIAIGSKNFLEISNRLALVYQRRDSLSLRIISEYEKIDKTIGNVSAGLAMISDSLRRVSELNLQPSIDLLGDSNKKLENSNTQLSDAVNNLNSINSDLSKLHFKNIWENAGYALGGVLVGVIVGAIIFK